MKKDKWEGYPSYVKGELRRRRKRDLKCGESKESEDIVKVLSAIQASSSHFRSQNTGEYLSCFLIHEDV